jgi:hypothetical protein
MIRGIWHAINGWVTFMPLIGYSQEQGAPYMTIEWWGCAASSIANQRNHSIIAIRRR